jgi:hypothetical protein
MEKGNLIGKFCNKVDLFQNSFAISRDTVRIAESGM